MENTRDKILRKTGELAELLVSKNESYGDSALNPVGFLSKADAEERLRVRIDDKLLRLAMGKEYQGDDTLLDLAGYVVLLMIAREGDTAGETAKSSPSEANPLTACVNGDDACGCRFS